jgi:hypothetical protein
MEERFRNEIKRYLRRPNAPRITPRDVPPLIFVSGNLPPTARNKMYHAIMVNMNFSGQWSMQTRAPIHLKNITANQDSLRNLLVSSKSLGDKSLGGGLDNGKTIGANCKCYEASNEQIVKFLNSYRWLEDLYKDSERPDEVDKQITFLREQKHGIKSWLIVAPQRESSFGESDLELPGLAPLRVKERHRVQNQAFSVYGEPAHRKIAEFLADIVDPEKPNLTTPTKAIKELSDKHRGVFTFYPVRENEKGDVTIGFELLFPKNNLGWDLNFRVRKKD